MDQPRSETVFNNKKNELVIWGAVLSMAGQVL